MQYRNGFVFGLLAPSAIAWSPILNSNFHVGYEEPASSLTGPSRGDDSPNPAGIKAAVSIAVPYVLLPYENHTALPDRKGNQMHYRFANIPYAKQPVADRRFKAAESISTVRLDPLPINDGKTEVVCPQEIPGWAERAVEFSGEFFSSGPLDPKWSNKITPANYTPLEHVIPVPDQSESCLVLDVFVPKRLFDDKNAVGKVVVSFMSQGFLFGSRNSLGLPEGLLEQSSQFGKDSDIVYISVNYRLGAFGWLAGDQFVKDGGLENAGLTDQMRALEWVKEYVSLFGGDPNEVTVIGKSGGASSIMHLLAANPRHHSRPSLNFNRAIIQSPAFIPVVDRSIVNNVYQHFLDAAGVEDFSGLQEASTETLIEANRKTSYYSPYGRFNYGPVVSNDMNAMIPAPPASIFKHGYSQADRLDRLMLSNNRREANFDAPPWIRTNAALREYIQELYPTITSSNLDAIISKYEISEGSSSERLKNQQVVRLFGDLGYDCNVWTIRKSVERERTYEYMYDMFLGYHLQDAGATFWNQTDHRLTEGNNEVQSQRLQRHLTSFIKSGDPNTETHPETDLKFYNLAQGQTENEGKMYMYLGTGKWPPSHLGGMMMNNNDTWQEMKDEDPLPPSEYCEFWEGAPYWDGDVFDGVSEGFLREQGQRHLQQEKLVVQEL